MRGTCSRLTHVLVLLLGLFLVGCGSPLDGEGDPETASTPTMEGAESLPDPTETAPMPTATQIPATPTKEAPLEYSRVDIPQAGLVFEVPDSWMRLEPEWAWAPELDAGAWIGVNWRDLEPSQEAEAVMLPSPSEVVSSEAAELALGSGRRFVINVFGATAEEGDTQAPVDSTHIHVLIIQARDGTRRAYDFYAVGRDGDQLAEAASVLQRMLDSAAALSTEVGGADDQIPDGVTRAKAILTGHLGTSEDDVALVSFEAVEWGDACLGIHTPGTVCAQVITPGYRVVLTADSVEYELHTNLTGTSVGIVP